ncbi:MAG: phosphopantothenate/pantothenate synthetase [Candidatus Thermoplasmatota archaeon]|nr:phosphopantothenate/pantothenate synthetase [Candidatus Thermoplasmatota archaeon]
MGDVPRSHPRYHSLMSRERLVEAASKGMLAESALIAHGRGEAFDYLLNESTCEAAKKAISEVATRLHVAERPILSLNGNATALAGDVMIACAAVLNCPIEINIYYRTPERMDALLSHLNSLRDDAKKLLPEIMQKKVDDVQILGDAPDGQIPNLEGPRANCHSEGILAADVILVPLEDGDRCEALIAMEKIVCVIDLNPLSRTARMADVTIVDELTRCAPLLLDALIENNSSNSEVWNNEENLQDSLNVMLGNLAES